MAIAKFHTLEDLIATGLPMFMATVSPSVDVGEVYLQDEVISQWDFGDYSDCYTYYDNLGGTTIHYVVNICKKLDDRSYQTHHLKKDMSNLNLFEELSS